MANQSHTDYENGFSETSDCRQSPSECQRASAGTEWNQEVPPRSSIGIRIVISAVTILSGMAVAPAGSVLTQYLISRLSKEQHLYNASTGYSVCDKDVNESSVIQANQLQATVSTLMIYYNYASTGPAIMFGLIIGAYADALGRRITLLLPLTGLTTRLLLTVFIMKYDLDLRLFYLAYGIDGLTGTGFVILIALCTIIADTNATTIDRILWITILNVLGSIASSVSSIVSGVMIKELGYFQTSVFLMIVSALCFFIPLIFLRETKPNQEVQTLNFFKNIKRVFGFFLFDGTSRHKLTFIISLSMFFFAVINEFGAFTIDTLYQLHRPFCWSSKVIGYYSALKNGGAYFLAMLVMAALKSHVKMEYFGLIAAFSQGASYCFEAFVKTTWQFFLVPVVGIPACLITSVIRGLMSSLARPDCQGDYTVRHVRQTVSLLHVETFVMGYLLNHHSSSPSSPSSSSTGAGEVFKSSVSHSEDYVFVSGLRDRDDEGNFPGDTWRPSLELRNCCFLWCFGSPLCGITIGAMKTRLLTLNPVKSSTSSSCALFTSICIFEIVCFMAANTIFNKIYAATVGTFPGAVYLCMTCCSFVTFVLIILYLKVHKHAQMPVYEKIINSEEDSR